MGDRLSGSVTAVPSPSRPRRSPASHKVPTGIFGFDEITKGGLPKGRVTVVLGASGCGKTIFALESLVAGAKRGQSGIFVTFEENPAQVRQDARHFDWALDRIGNDTICFIDGQLSDCVVKGTDFDLEGLLAVLGAKAKQLGATCVVLDGLDMLLGHLGEGAAVRREIFRIRAWAHSSALTCIITAKVHAGDQPRSMDHESLQFAADCVVSLHHRLSQGAAMRTIRVQKYRGDAHSSNEFPFTITAAGLEVAAGTSAVLEHAVFNERVSSGIERLDTMLGGGYYRGSSVLISGAPGTSKTSLAASFAEAACRRKEPTVYVSFDEAPLQIIRNVASIGLDLERHVRSGLLEICSLRARTDNSEAHVSRIRALLIARKARSLVIDPLSALARSSDPYQADRAAVQILDVAKKLGVTTVNTSLLGNAAQMSEETPIGISTIADTWLHVSYVSRAGERNRALTIVKSRGTKHSNQVRELVLTNDGVTLADVYLSGGEVLMGTMRWEKEVQDRHAKDLALTESDLKQKQTEGFLAETRARIQAARAELAVGEIELQRILVARAGLKTTASSERVELSLRRGGDRKARPPRRAAVATRPRISR